MTRDQDRVAEFLQSDEVRRLELASDPRYEADLIGHLGPDAFAELRAAAGSVLGKSAHLGVRSSKNLVFVPGVMGSLLAPVNVPAGIWWIDARAYRYIDELGLSPDGSDADNEAKHVEPLRIDLSYTGFLSMLFQRNEFGVEAYPYDWRKPLSASAAGLRDLVGKMHQTNGGQPVHLVAHSMGGLVVRAALVEYGKDLWPNVGKIVFLGTPHYGATAIAFYLKNHFWGFDLIALLGVLLSRDTFRSLWGPLMMLPAPRGIYPGTRPNDIQPWRVRTTGETYVHPCGNFDFYKADEWRLGLDDQRTKTLQNILDHAAEVHARLRKAHLDLAPEQRNRMLIIAGVGHKTPFRLGGDALLGVWERMEKTTSRVPGDRHREGDGSVPLASAELEGVGTRYVQGEHGALPNYPPVVAEVIRWLLGRPLTLPQSARGALAAPHLGMQPTGKSLSPYLEGSACGARPVDRWDLVETPAERIEEMKRKLEAGQLTEIERVKIL
jgi:pimeloyl-ACP methyl ester carboxylesterase